MRYQISPPDISGSELKSRLLHLPHLGGSNTFSAHDTLVALYRTPARPGLDTARETIFSSKGAIPHAWRHEMDCGILVVMPDRSALIFARSDTPDIFRMLPFVFRLPRSVPFGTNRPESGDTNMVFDHRGSGEMRFGIRPAERVGMFFDIMTPDAAPIDIADLLKRARASLEMECAGWIEAQAKHPFNPDVFLPVALSKVRLPQEGENFTQAVGLWLSKIVAYSARAISAPDNPLYIALRDPVFSQNDGSVHLVSEVLLSNDDNPAGDPVARHLGKVLPEILTQGASPFDLDKMFPRVAIDSDQAMMAINLSSLSFDVSTFTVTSLSNHELLQLDTLIGLKDIVASHKEAADTP